MFLEPVRRKVKLGYIVISSSSAMTDTSTQQQQQQHQEPEPEQDRVRRQGNSSHGGLCTIEIIWSSRLRTSYFLSDQYILFLFGNIHMKDRRPCHATPAPVATIGQEPQQTDDSSITSQSVPERTSPEKRNNRTRYRFSDCDRAAVVVTRIETQGL